MGYVFSIHESNGKVFSDVSKKDFISGFNSLKDITRDVKLVWEKDHWILYLNGFNCAIIYKHRLPLLERRNE